MGSGGELKFKDFSKAPGAIANPADGSGGEENPTTILCLNGVGQGDTMSTRIGTKITMEKLFMNGVITVSPEDAITAGERMPCIFVAIVLDTQTNGGSATGIDSENVFSNPAGDSSLASTPLRNMSYTERYKVLKTKTIRVPQLSSFQNGTNGSVNGVNIPFSMSVKLGGLNTKFQTGTTTGYVGTVIDNSLHCIAYSSSSDLNPTIGYNARLRYRG